MSLGSTSVAVIFWKIFIFPKSGGEVLDHSTLFFCATPSAIAKISGTFLPFISFAKASNF